MNLFDTIISGVVLPNTVNFDVFDELAQKVVSASSDQTRQRLYIEYVNESFPHNDENGTYTKDQFGGRHEPVNFDRFMDNLPSRFSAQIRLNTVVKIRSQKRKDFQALHRNQDDKVRIVHG